MKDSTPAFSRNHRPIAKALADALDGVDSVLEIASGPGAHAAYFASRFPAITWQPSDVDNRALASAEAWHRDSGLENLLRPIRLDVTEPDWPVSTVDVVLAINLIHISPHPQVANGLFGGAAAAGVRRVILYGPFFREGVASAASNIGFDRSLRERNPEWGVRWLHDVEEHAARFGFPPAQVIEMPANNCVLVF